jgi:NADPH-dependent 2,4-dienoyl-CoA reductase/sulfur reductase-like enzyme
VTLSNIVVVGASAAGLTAAETLRREGYRGRLTLVDAEARWPYDRPPLSKQVLRGEWDADRVALRSPEILAELGADWRFGVPARSLDLDSREVLLWDGARVQFDGLVVATGVRARKLPIGRGLVGIHALRGLEEALELRQAMLAARSVVVAGAGFLGTEAAAVAAELGCSVTIVDPLSAPLIRQLGPDMGARVVRLHREHGVQVRCETGIASFLEEHGRVVGVVLSDGSEIPAEVVLVAIGAEPVVDWLQGSGLPLGDGVLCDQYCQAAPDVVAAGDVASWVHPALGRIRLEHRLNATEQGMAAARTLLGQRIPFAPVPYFWSDQFNVRIQVYGRPNGENFTVVEGDLDEGRFAAVQTDADARLVAVAGWNMPRQVRNLRQRLVEQQNESALAQSGRRE